MSKPLIIYHEVKPGIFCMDGLGAAWVCSKALPSPEYLGYSYGLPEPVLTNHSMVFIVDFSFKHRIIEAWSKKGIKVVLLDHHKTALNDLASLSSVVSNGVLKHKEQNFLAYFNQAECGSTIAWKYFFRDQSMPPFLAYIRDRDLGKYELPYSEQIKSAITKATRGKDLEYSFQALDQIATYDSDRLISWGIENGQQAFENRTAKIDTILRLRPIEEKVINGVRFGTITLKKSDVSYYSDVGRRLYKLRPEFEFVALLMPFENKISMRSRNDGYDVESLAIKFSGGGHFSAASIPYTDWDNINEFDFGLTSFT